MDAWKVAPDERAKHDAQFSSLTAGTHVTGDQARGFFMQSNLPQAVLGQIWGLADLTRDGKMDRKEFSIAMTLIKRKLQGYQIPPTLPPSMMVEPLGQGGNPMMMGGTLPHGMTGMPAGMGMAPMSTATLPGRLPSHGGLAPMGGVANHPPPGSPARSIDGNEWAIPQANRLKYNQMFNKEDRKRSGYLTGLDARQQLISTGLPQNLLAQIWSLSDVDSDGRLTSEEFSLAMFLADMVKMGQPLPMTLPPNLIPPSMRARSRSNSGMQAMPTSQPGQAPIQQTDSFGDLIPGGFGAVRQPADVEPLQEELVLGPVTLEDKRRENFAKGNAELEKRRAELRDQQRKEEEARQAKERAEQEKRDAIKREQERKRLADQERMMERQRQLEAERDEQRRKALEAREAARKEMERQRQAEWERQRKHALLAEKKRHEESVQQLESQVNNLKYEIETMDNKKRELVTRIAEGKETVIKNTGYIDDMRVTRDSLLNSISSNGSIKLEQENLFTKYCAEFTQVRQALQNRQAQNPISDNFRHQQNLHSAKKEQVEKLRAKLTDMEGTRSGVSGEVTTSQSALSELQKSIADLKSSQTLARQRAESKKSEWERIKRSNAEEKVRLAEEQRREEEAEKHRKIEEENKKKEEDKWSAFKDVDFSAPSATTALPGQTNGASFAADWGTAASSTTATPAAKQDDFWSDASSQQPSADMWGDPGQSNDMFADAKSGSSPANDLWATTTTTPVATASANLFEDAFASKPIASSSVPAIKIPPPQKTPKKETTFGFPPTEKPVENLETQRQAPIVEPVSKNRKVEIYEAQYDFAARNSDELNLIAEDKVKVYPDEQASAEPGWMSGWKGDKCGIFPSNYVVKQREVYEPAAVNTSSSAAVNIISSTAEPSVTNSEPEVSSGNDMIRSDSAFDNVRNSPNPESGSPAPAGLTCVAAYPWRAKKSNHLSFNQGDELKVLMQQDLWWQGRLADGTEGWFPKSYVTVTENSYDNSAVQPKPVTITAMAEPAPSRLYDLVPDAQPSASDSSRFYDQVPEEKGTKQAPASQQITVGERYAAMHPYESDVVGDLSFDAGELILVTSKDGEWWTGQIGDRKGIFPANYVTADSSPAAVEKLKEAQSNPPKIPNHPNGSSTIPQSNPISTTVTNAPNVAQQLMEKRHPRAAPRKPAIASNVQQTPSPVPQLAPAVPALAGSQVKEIGKVIAPYEATGKEQLSLKPNQLIQIRKKAPSGWWEGELMAKGQKKQIGWFPKDYVRMLPSTGNKGGTLSRSDTPTDQVTLGSASSDVSSPRSAATTPQPAPISLGKVQASYPYAAQNEDELTFAQGDIITIVNKNDPDWWEGQLGEQSGVFPANYVQAYTEPLSEEERKRQQAITELMDTEAAYVDDMLIALEVFYKPLEESKAIPLSELRAIFVNWKELIHCNRKLVNAFKVRRNTCGEGEPINVIGDVLIENFPNMTPYIRFCSRQLIAAQMLQKRVETDENAKQFISKCQQDARVHGMPLSSYILKPMQRITKYPLLINRIKYHTPEDHADYQYISEATQNAQELANQVNEGVRETDNSDKLEWLQNHVSCEGLAENITFNSLTNALGQRKFIYCGALTKLRSGRELYAFLFNDFLLFTTAMTHGSVERVFQLDSKGHLFKMYKEPIFLNEVTVREPVNPEKPDTDNVCFQICHIETIIDIKCTTTTERNAWLKRLNQATEAALSMEKVKRERAMSLSRSPSQKGIGRLLVIIMEGVDLLASDANVAAPPVGRLVLVLQEAVDIVGVKPATGKSDPYCEVSMGSLLHKTKVIPNTLNPKWNSSMQFPIKSVEDDVLCFTVFDQDRFSPNGRTELRVKDILRETKEKRGPILKYAKLQEVKTGDIKVKLDLQIYSSSSSHGVPIPSSRTLM